MNQAEMLLSKGLFAEALLKFKIAAENADNPSLKSRALFFIGKISSIYLDQHDRALRVFDTIMTDYADCPVAADALFESGIILFNLKRYKEAHAAFSRHIRKYPGHIRRKSVEVWAGISAELLLQHNKQAAPPQLQKKSVRLKPQNLTTLRVLIKKNAEEVRVTSKDNLLLSGIASKKMIYSGWGPIVFKRQGSELIVNGRRLNPAACQVTAGSSTIGIDNSTYRGFIAIHNDANGILVINHVPVEDYLYGVISKEMPDRWNRQALMAQAVAARTYALYMRQKNRHEAYDLEDTTAAQVYGGYNAETKRSTAAVDATRGQVMTYNGRLILAYFHSSSGGHTEDPVNVWNVKIPYLRGIPDNFSTNCPLNSWKYFLPYDDMIRRLNSQGIKISRIQKFDIAGRSESGRIKTIRILADQGVIHLSSNLFRASVGETKLKSTLCDIFPTADGILFKGKGYGHGVGMSQWGAKEMAMTGCTYRDILNYYYNDIKIVTIRNLDPHSA